MLPRARKLLVGAGRRSGMTGVGLMISGYCAAAALVRSRITVLDQYLAEIVA